MSTHSVGEASDQLSQLIDRTLNGEEIVITRHGQPVIELRPIQARPALSSDLKLDWLAARRVGCPAAMDAGTLVGRMRDEDDR